MTWQSMADVLDRTATNEAHDAARNRRDRSVGTRVHSREHEQLKCPGCTELVPADALFLHFALNHEDIETACTHRGCTFEAKNRISLAAHKRYRHREQP